FGTLQQIQQFSPAENTRIVMNLEGADAGSEVDDAAWPLALEPGEKLLHVEAEVEIENRLAVFDQEIAVARSAADHRRRNRFDDRLFLIQAEEADGVARA